VLLLTSKKESSEYYEVKQVSNYENGDDEEEEEDVVDDDDDMMMMMLVTITLLKAIIFNDTLFIIIISKVLWISELRVRHRLEYRMIDGSSSSASLNDDSTLQHSFDLIIVKQHRRVQYISTITLSCDDENTKQNWLVSECVSIISFDR